MKSGTLNLDLRKNPSHLSGWVKNLGRWMALSLVILSLLCPPDASAQKRQRSKTKAKTTAPAKKTTSKSTSPKTSAEAKKKQAETQKEIKLTKEQIEANEKEVKKNLAELGKIDQDIDASNKKIKELGVKISQLNTQISSLETNIAKNESDLERLRSEYLKAVKKMRVNKKNKSSLAFIFSSKSLNQALRRMRYLREFSAWRERQTAEISAKTADLKNQRDALAKAKEEQSSALTMQQSSMKLLAQQHTKQEALVADLKKNGDALQSHLKKKQAEAAELNNMVSQLIAQEQRAQEQQRAAEEEARRKAEEEEARRKVAEEARRKAAEEASLAQNSPNNNRSDNSPKDNTKGEKSNKRKTPEQKPGKGKVSDSDYASARKRAPRNKGNNASSATDIPVSSASSFQDMKGKLPAPSTGSFVITSKFGRQSMPDLPDVVYDNPGIDAETNAGASARAVFKGKVSGVYLLPGYNTVVIVNHGNYYTVYGNIASPSVKNGDSVDAGAALGQLALNDDDSSHASIHFEVWKNREKLNPQEWLRN